MNTLSVILKFYLVVHFECSHLYAAGLDNLPGAFSDDTVKSKEIKKLEIQQEKIQFRKSQNRFAIKSSYVFAILDTKISFELAQGNLSSTLSLEDNLGLPSKSYFFTGSVNYRITPRSGIYTMYYGINRLETSQTNKEYIFKNATIPAGTNIQAYFNTQVISTEVDYNFRGPALGLSFIF